MTHYVYRFFDADGVLLYVGESKDPWKRWRGHRSTSSFAPLVARGRISVFSDRLTALQAERNAIVDEGPRFNVKHNPGVSSVPRRARVGRVKPLDTDRLRLLFQQSGLSATEFAHLAGWGKPHELTDFLSCVPVASLERWAAEGIARVFDLPVDVLFEAS